MTTVVQIQTSSAVLLEAEGVERKAHDGGIIVLDSIKKSYRLGQLTVPALKGVNLELRRGEFTSVIGASGSGKSTLLNLIGCIDDPDSGSIYVDGVDVTKLDDDAKSRLRNQKIGFIFQSFNLIPVLTIEENVELPLLINKSISPTERRDRVRSAISNVGLEKFLRNLPDQLSGGQRQRVAIARALAGSPDLVLADEPTANLDSENSHRIIELMLELNEKLKVTFLFSTHDDRLMGRMSRIIRIQDGVIQECTLHR